MDINLFVVDNSQENSMVMSGGERIAIELCRRWAGSEKANVSVIGSNLTEALWSPHLTGAPVRFHRIVELKEGENLFISYLKRVLKGTAFARRFSMDSQAVNLVYSASDFWPDSLPALFLYLANRDRCRWIAGFYLFAPNPLRGFMEKGSWRLPTLRNTLYWLSQKPIYLVVKHLADAVFVTSDPDTEPFVTPRRGRHRVVVIRGGVDTSPASSFYREVETVGSGERYDAVFVGRFHPQKGVVDLVEIWKLVTEEIPGATMAIIGAGPLEDQVAEAIKRNGLQDEISMLGYMDGEKKYEVFKRSSLILHPALYDSGGMAAAEGMAWGLAGVSYDLRALKTYYPRGMVKVPVGDKAAFAGAVARLLRDESARRRLGDEARELIMQTWSWESRAGDIWQSLDAEGLLERKGS
jgi:glycosyltransferase involved in cell wall biosynthesis